MTNKPTWEEDLQNMIHLVVYKHLNTGIYADIFPDLKDFISTKLAEQRKELIEKIEANFNFTVSTTKQDLINLIKQD